MHERAPQPIQAMRDVICLSHLRWGFVFQRPNHLMSLAARERRVFFVEEPTYGSMQAELDVREVEPNLWVVVPHLPSHERARANDVLRGLLSELVRHRSIAKPVVWFYTPMALDFARTLEASVIAYDCMDELSAFQGAPAALRTLEAELFERADIVFTGGQSLFEAKRERHPNVHCFPSSVDVAHFATARERLPDPADQAALERPRLGYFGVVDERIDLELLAHIADERPAWQLIVVGPVVKIEASSLPVRSNIHYLGQKTYQELPSYLAGWDAALMPFAQNEATRFISPTKTLEYLAGGKQVISTPIADVVKPYGERGLVEVARAENFVQAIERVLRSPVQERAADVERFLAGTSWQATWRGMSKLIESEPGRKVDSRADDATTVSKAEVLGV
jgi:glycosyltransferase involved in cell wall biosynthesis